MLHLLRSLVERATVGTVLEVPCRAVQVNLFAGTALCSTNNVYNYETIRVLRSVIGPSDTGIDVGCHKGVFLFHLLRAAPAGRHFGFEPIPEIREALRGRFGAQAEILGSALGEARGKAVFHVHRSTPGLSSLAVPEPARGGSEYRTIEVEVAPLDELIPEALPVRFMKIDVEGGELGVLRGAVRTLTTRRPVVVFEHSREAASAFGHTPEALFDFLAGSGYAVSLMSRWLRRLSPLGRNEFLDESASGRNFCFIASSEWTRG